jgi:hypothetical protein
MKGKCADSKPNASKYSAKTAKNAYAQAIKAGLIRGGKRTVKKRITRKKQRGGQSWLTGESKLTAAAKAGRLVDDKPNSVIQLLDAIIKDAMPLAKYKEILTYLKSDNQNLYAYVFYHENHVEAVNKLINALDAKLTGPQKKAIGESVGEKIAGGKLGKNKTIVEILTHILGYRGDGFVNPAFGVKEPGTPPHTSRVANPFYGMKHNGL